MTAPIRQSTDTGQARNGAPQTSLPLEPQTLPARILRNRARREKRETACETFDARTHKGNCSYAALCRDLSGQIVADLEQWERGNQLALNLQLQTSEIANRMESVGFDVRTGRDLALVGLHSRSVRKLPAYRDLRILPTVARRKRRKLQKYVERFIDCNPYSRMWTFTTGTRCCLWELKDRLQWLHRKVSKLNSRSFMRKNGLRVEARFSELGEIVRFDGSPPTFHPHAHVLVSQSRKLSEEDWGSLLLSVGKWWDAWWNECGRVRDSRELVKYCAKPGDLLKLDGHQLVEISQVMSKVRMVETLGTIRKQRRHHEDKGLRIDKVKGSWRTSRKWNLGNDPRPRGRWDGSPKAPTLRLLARCVPAPLFQPVLEPIFLVEGLGASPPERVLEMPEARSLLYSSHLGSNSPPESEGIRQNPPNEYAHSPPST